MRRAASYVGRGVAIVAMGLAIGGLAGYVTYLALTATIRHFVE